MKVTFGLIPTPVQKDKISVYSRSLARGDMNPDQYVAKVGKILDKEASDATIFEQATLDTTLNPTPSLKTLVKEIRKLGINVSLLSDMYLFEAKITRHLGRYDGFDYVALSAEKRMTKKEPEYFMETINHFKLEPCEALFVDDRIENTKIAESIGIDTIHADKSIYFNPDDLVAEIRKKIGIKEAL